MNTWRPEPSHLLLFCREENPGQQLKDNLTYIKKPPNAFMLFLEEQRPHVAPELKRQGTSKVNKALGKKVSRDTDGLRLPLFTPSGPRVALHKPGLRVVVF